MVSATISRSQMRGLQKAIEGTKRSAKKEMAIAVNKTAKKGTGIINKEIRTELAVKKKAIDSVITVKRKANAKAREASASLELKKSKRLALKEFGARQTKAGVSYKISKSKGRSTVPGGFMGPRPGAIAVKLNGHAFIRKTADSRSPIRKLWGPSPWGVFTKRGMRRPSTKEIRVELKKQMARRINFIKLKKEGQV